MNKAIFLDRDGTINKDVVYLDNIESLEIIDGTYESLKKFKEKGYLIIVVTNQSAIGRGLLTHETLDLIHDEINRKLDYLIDYFMYCPHAPADKCNCRKPSPYMLIQAKEMFDIDFNESWFIGDSDEDMLCGKQVGCKTIGVRTGLIQKFHSADYICSDIKSASELI